MNMGRARPPSNPPVRRGPGDDGATTNFLYD